MNKKDEFLSKYIKTYNDLKQKQINVLDNKKERLQIKLKEETDKFNKLLKIKEKFKQEDEVYDTIYNSLIYVLKSRGILFNIPNNNFRVNEWDNLYINKKDNLYMLMDKDGNILHIIEKKYNDVIGYIVQHYSYSIVVTRIDANLIKVQLRILAGGVL